MTDLETVRSGIVAKRASARIGRRLVRFTAFVAFGLAAAGCYPRYDWRDYRPDCSKTWCEFVATFPGKATSATRDVQVGAMRLPLSIHVASVGDVRFAIAAFDLLPGSDVAAARAMLDRKLLDDVGATDGRRDRIVVHAADHSDVAAETIDAEGVQGGQAWRAQARFVERKQRLVEIVVIGPADELAKSSGRQAVETFFTSLRLD